MKKIEEVEEILKELQEKHGSSLLNVDQLNSWTHMIHTKNTLPTMYPQTCLTSRRLWLANHLQFDPQMVHHLCQLEFHLERE